MIIVVLLTLYALLSGLFSGWRRLVKMRRASPPGEVLLTWQSVPASAYRTEPVSAWGLTLHGAGVLALGLLGFGVTLTVWGQKESWFLRGRDAIALFLMLAVLIISWDFIGHILAQPLVGLIKVAANFSVGERGLFYGPILQTWGHFSHYSQQDANQEICLHPARCPQLVTFRLNPPDRGDYERLIQLVPTYLPASAPPANLPGTQRPSVFFVLLMLTVYPFLLVGIWLAANPGVLSALYFGLSVFAATRLGGKLIRSYT